MGDDYPFELRQPRSGIAGSNALMGPIGRLLLERNRQRLEEVQRQNQISPQMQELFNQVRQVREEYYRNPASLLPPGMKGLFDEIRRQRELMTPEEMEPMGFEYTGGYGRSGIDPNYLLGFLGQNSMTPMRNQALLGGGLAMLGVGAS